MKEIYRFTSHEISREEFIQRMNELVEQYPTEVISLNKDSFYFYDEETTQIKLIRIDNEGVVEIIDVTENIYIGYILNMFTPEIKKKLKILISKFHPYGPFIDEPTDRSITYDQFVNKAFSHILYLRTTQQLMTIMIPSTLDRELVINIIESINFNDNRFFFGYELVDIYDTPEMFITTYLEDKEPSTAFTTSFRCNDNLKERFDRLLNGDKVDFIDIEYLSNSKLNDEDSYRG